MQRFNYELLEGADREMAVWLDGQINANIQLAMERVEKDCPEHFNSLGKSKLHFKSVLNARVLRDMPPRLHLMKTYILSRMVVGKLKKELTGEAEKDYYHIEKIDAETACGDALFRYMRFDIEECPEDEPAEDDQKASAFGMDLTAALVPASEETTARLTKGEIPESVLASSIQVKPSPGWRCQTCKAVIEGEPTCTCGSTDFTPLVVVDLPVNDMEAMSAFGNANAPASKTMH
ncbi:TPA: hypothetical protein JG832_002437 [Enterobacter hormaechei subsp. xiangfangensis]|nr:hypothetical protein [Enterobacter hormaechei subsp. xiangfangensis]HAV1890573.1 hypothetical protein [Enterobacter hormaechei subsp. xiangfangensis]